jgi:hypothetical protein
MPAALAFALVLLMALAVGNVAAAPQAELWPRWSEHDPESNRVVDHEAWGSFLDEYLIHDHPSGVSRVRYGAVSGADKRSLDEYLNRLQGIEVSELNRAEQRAFWLNLYNAYTIKLILDHYPVDSIKEIDISGVFDDGPWGADIISVEGVDLTLDDIEHRILRPIYEDPLIHYAVNCASIGCPNLQPEPFTAENYRELAVAGARAFINHPRGVNPEADPLEVSSIYNWFTSDFGGSWEGVREHLLRYADTARREVLQGYDGNVNYAYDWSLNEP